MSGWRAIASLLLAALILWRNLSATLLFLRPRWTRLLPRPPGSPEIDEVLFEQMESELTPLGFRRIGAHCEKPPLRRAVLSYDFANESERLYASAWSGADGARLYLLTAFDGGAFVLTADHKRPGVQRDGRYLAGGIPGASPEQLLAAHRRRVEQMTGAGRQVQFEPTLEARLAHGEAWFRGPGGREVRLRNANEALLSLMALGIVAAVARALLGS